jgi:hypothetical protein
VRRFILCRSGLLTFCPACNAPCTSFWRVGCVTKAIWSTLKPLVRSVRCAESPRSSSRERSLVWTWVRFGEITAEEYAVLQVFLSSPRSTLKFAATRTLASLALSHPSSVAACNVDLENLISDSNRSVATYAITTLLKVGPPRLGLHPHLTAA